MSHCTSPRSISSRGLASVGRALSFEVDCNEQQSSARSVPTSFAYSTSETVRSMLILVPPGVLRIKPGSVVFIMQNLMRDLPRYTKCVVLSISEKRGAVRLVKVKNLEDHVDWVESDGTKGRRLNLVNDAFSIPRTIHEIKHQHLTIQRTQFPISPA